MSNVPMIFKTAIKVPAIITLFSVKFVPAGSLIVIVKTLSLATSSLIRSALTIVTMKEEAPLRRAVVVGLVLTLPVVKLPGRGAYGAGRGASGTDCRPIDQWNWPRDQRC